MLLAVCQNLQLCLHLNFLNLNLACFFKADENTANKNSDVQKPNILPRSALQVWQYCVEQDPYFPCTLYSDFQQFL